jgi:hypothetical protein
MEGLELDVRLAGHVTRGRHCNSRRTLTLCRGGGRGKRSHQLGSSLAARSQAEAQVRRGRLTSPLRKKSLVSEFDGAGPPQIKFARADSARKRSRLESLDSEVDAKRQLPQELRDCRNPLSRATLLEDIEQPTAAVD